MYFTTSIYNLTDNYYHEEVEEGGDTNRPVSSYSLNKLITTYLQKHIQVTCFCFVQRNFHKDSKSVPGRTRRSKRGVSGSSRGQQEEKDSYFRMRQFSLRIAIELKCSSYRNPFPFSAPRRLIRVRPPRQAKSSYKSLKVCVVELTLELHVKNSAENVLCSLCLACFDSLRLNRSLTFFGNVCARVVSFP